MDMRLPRGHFCGEILKSCDVAGFILNETSYAAGSHLPRHSHENAYICFVRQGAYTEIYGNKTRNCGPSTLAFHPPDELHSERFHNAEGRSFNIEIGPQWLNHFREHSTVLEAAVDFQGGPLMWLAVRLYDEFRRMDELSPLAIEGLMLEIIVEASRRNFSAKGRTPPLWLKQAKEILHEGFPESLSVATIANTVGVHPVYLASEFRRNYHSTIGEYVRRLRIEFACREISSSDAPLIDIALAAGFSHQSHFSRTFKRLTGMTPAQYRAVFRAS
ncbi:MAG: AraC family transcriptional regulator [Blastocatellia bacterium]|nr:AraC family transcriptional regulator [Blastocatellia bacterium]